MLSRKKLKKGLSVIVNTKNEEHHLKDCLDSVKGWADEIIVVDMSSQDKTVAIAKRIGAKVYSVKDIGWVEPVRNWSFNKASYEWILSLDADERVPKTLKAKIDEIIAQDNYDVVKIPWKNIFFGKWIQHTFWWPDHHPRLFKKGYLKIQARIHPEVTIKGRVLQLEAVEELAMIHYNAESIDIWMKKINSYTSREHTFEGQRNFTPQQILDYFDSEFVGRYFDSKGYLDGVHGYILSKFMEYYRFLEFVKYWEIKKYPKLFSNMKLKKAVETKYDSSLKNRALLDEVMVLRQKMNFVTSSKIYKIWSFYSDFKKRFLKYLNV